MRSSRTTPCLASSARCHIVIEHEGAGEGARGQGAPRLSPLLAPPTLRCDGGDGSAESATAARASELDATTRPARSGRCGGATAAVAVRRFQRGAQQCRGSDARPRRRRGRLPFLRACRVRRRAHAVRRRGRGGYATYARVAVSVIQRFYLQRGLAPGRSSRRALSAERRRTGGHAAEPLAATGGVHRASARLPSVALLARSAVTMHGSGFVASLTCSFGLIDVRASFVPCATRRSRSATTATTRRSRSRRSSLSSRRARS